MTGTALRTIMTDRHALARDWQSDYRRVRALTTALCEPLEPEDYVAQSMPDASPVKWHLAHTTWFFEQFALQAHAAAYAPFHADYAYLFNSYYEQIGPQIPRASRGLLTRPTTREIRVYRAQIDAAMQALLRSPTQALAAVIELGLHHEQQHQELLLTDLKHLLSRNPLLPAYRTQIDQRDVAPRHNTALRWIDFAGGLHAIGAAADGFSFDNERPRHRVYTPAFALADRLVSNADYCEFVRDGGYRRPSLWLSEGWQLANTEGWERPLYWQPGLDAEFTLRGVAQLDAATPLCHVSYFEADAFARWAQVRLPTEAEWEFAAAQQPLEDCRLGPGLHPQAATDDVAPQRLQQLYATLWQWTASAYLPYPGYRTDPGAIGEYNGKFMVNQQVLRGGSCASPTSHLRATYRNFFPPHARWQFAGIRLAKDR